MDKLRLKQAEDLIIKASNEANKIEKMKIAKEGKINIASYEKAIKELISLEDFIYSSLPNHDLDSENAKEFTDKLIRVRENIDDMLRDFSVLEKIDSKEKVDTISNEVLIILPKNNIKKSIVKLGINAQNIVVASVPLTVDDMKEINPKIPDNALKGISKKIEHINNDIKRKINNSNLNKILVLAEPDLNGELLTKRAQEMYGANIHLEDDLKNISGDKLVELINETLS